MKKHLVLLSIPARLILQAFLIGHLFAGQIEAGSEAGLKIVPTPSPQFVSAEAQAELEKFSSDGRSWTKFKYKKQIAKTASKYNLDPQLIYATIMTESEGNEFAYRFESSLNEASYCMGQILESTARSLGFSGKSVNLFEPGTCIDLIGKYHQKMMEAYGQLTPRQLARAYNSGSPWKRPVWGHLSRFKRWYYEEG